MSEPEILDEAGLQRVWRGVVQTRARRVRHRRLLAACAATVVVSAVSAAAGWWLGTVRHESAHSAPGAAGTTIATVSGAALEVALAEPASAIALADGSRIERGPGARLAVLEDRRDALTLLLVAGATRVEVTPEDGRQWLIECGVATVELRDAWARIQRVGARVEISVERGSALVRGEVVPDRVQRVDAPQTLVVERPEARTARAGDEGASAGSGAVSRTESGARVRAASMAEPTRELSAHAIEPAATRDQPLARDTPAAPAPNALGPAPSNAPATREARHPDPPTSVGEPRLLTPDPAVVLLARADRARARGEPAEAAALLDELLATHADHAAAPIAAFDLARLELDVLGRPPRAIAAIERALALGLPAALADDARARRVEAYARAGDQDGAQRAAADYRHHHPDGRRRADVERWTQR